MKVGIMDYLLKPYAKSNTILNSSIDIPHVVINTLLCTSTFIDKDIFYYFLVTRSSNAVLPTQA